MTKIEVIIPLFNEVQNIVPLIRRLDAALQPIRNEARTKYVFINDGSQDGTLQLIERLVREREDIVLIDLIHNFGHSAALACGIDHFESDVAIVMDGDLQDPPEAIPALYQAWKDGHPTVAVERGNRSERHAWRFKAFYRILHRITQSLPPIQFGTFCLLDKSVVDRMRHLKERNRYFPGLVSLSSQSVFPVRFNRESRAHGDSRVGPWGLLNLAITAFLSFSNVPVRLVSIFGLVSSVLALGMGLGIISIKLFTAKAIPGWASQMTLLAFASGIQLLCLGLMGEYVARIYEEVKARPLYWVDSILEKNKGRRSKKEVA